MSSKNGVSSSSRSTAISIRGLSKSYNIAQNAGGYRTVQETILERFKNPLGRPQFNQFWALQDVEFDVQRGEVVGIIGRNGAGKSTLLKILSRITRPTTGEVHLYGRVGSLLEVGTGFHPELTGRENIYLNGTILGMKRPDIERHFDSIVAFAEVEKFLDTPVKRYSSGMYVRLAFAVAAHLNPDILIVDEVLAVGDAQFQKKCLGKMGEVSREEGRTVLFVSHNMAAVHSLCNRAILLRSGRVSKAGAIDEVIDEYYSQVRTAPQDIFTGVIRNVHTINIKDEATNRFFYQDTIRIVLTLDAGSDFIQTPHIGIGVNTGFGQRVFTVGTYFSRDKLPGFTGRVQVVCEIKDIPLSPGNYALKVALASGHQSNDIDVVQEAGEFDIMPADLFGSGQLPSINQGSIAVFSDWKMMSEEQISPISSPLAPSNTTEVLP